MRLDGSVWRESTMPGPIHNGDGSMQLIIDERADAKQREALEKIATGQETVERSTMWWIYGTMSPNKRPTLYKLSSSASISMPVAARVHSGCAGDGRRAIRSLLPR